VPRKATTAVFPAGANVGSKLKIRKERSSVFVAGSIIRGAESPRPM